MCYRCSITPELSMMIWSASLPSAVSSRSTAWLITSSASGPMSGDTVLTRKVWISAFELMCFTKCRNCLMLDTDSMMQFFRKAFSTAVNDY